MIANHQQLCMFFSPIWRHCLIAHQGKEEDMNIIMRLDKKCNDPLTRQLREGILINRATPGSILNSKSEFKQPKVARINLQRTLP